ncbi:MAG: DinB family protein [Bacteroidota bacterium]
MITAQLSGSINALLEEYKKAINELIHLIESLNPEQLSFIADPNTNDLDCRSIGAILAHVIHSGYGYTVYIENSIGLNKTRPDKAVLITAAQYIDQLNSMFDYCKNFFKQYPAIELEEKEHSKKIQVNWGQVYNIEQLLEHAIVHVLRHRRQIAKFASANV